MSDVIKVITSKTPDKEVENIVKCLETIGFTCFYCLPNMNQQQLGYEEVQSGEHLEIDIIAIYEKFCIFIEVTTKNSGNMNKLKDFNRNLNILLDVDVETQLSNLSIPQDYHDLYECIEEKRRLFIGFSQELVRDKIITQRVNPGNNLIYVYNAFDFSYLELISECVGKFALYEFLDSLDITSSDISDSQPSEQPYDCISLTGKKFFASNKLIKLFAFKAPVYDLLRISKVFRHGAIGLGTSETGYQRILNPSKILSIQRKIRSIGERITFPNAITVVFNKNVVFDAQNKIIKVPVEFGSLSVLDGQHRLFAYAKSGLTDSKLKKVELFVIGIQFSEISKKNELKAAAETFIEVNKKQTSVPTGLIYLTEYEIMGLTNPRALAGKVILDLNSKSDNLENVFATRPVMKEKRLDRKPIAVTTVIQELSKIYTVSDLDGLRIFSEDCWNKYKRENKYKKLINETKKHVNIFFRELETVFSEDFNSNDSILFSTKYISAFVRIMVDQLKTSNDITDIRQCLTEKRTIIEHNNSSQRGPNNELFHGDIELLPDLTTSVTMIYEYLTNERDDSE